MHKEKINRTFKGIWIPKEIWLSTELTIMEKLFLVEINSLDNDKSCFASNDYFSVFFNITKTRCSQIIKSLEKKGFVKIVLQRQGKQIVKRSITVLSKSFDPMKKISYPYEENLHTPMKKISYPYEENLQDNNTLYNNTFNNNTNNISINDLNSIYTLYPPKCKESNRSTGKTSKNKDKIAKLLKTHSVSELKNIINVYIEDCKKTNTYIKNFSTFLNNLPDINEKEIKVKKEFIVFTRLGCKDIEVELKDWPAAQKMYGIQITGYKKITKEV